MLGLGIVFQMPMLVFFLSRFGVITAGFMIKHFKYAVLGIVVIAAVITPWVGVLSHLKGLKSAPQSAIAIDRVCWQGEAVAAVVAITAVNFLLTTVLFSRYRSRIAYWI